MALSSMAMISYKEKNYVASPGNITRKFWSLDPNHRDVKQAVSDLTKVSRGKKSEIVKDRFI